MIYATPLSITNRTAFAPHRRLHPYYQQYLNKHRNYDTKQYRKSGAYFFLQSLDLCSLIAARLPQGGGGIFIFILLGA